MKTRPIIFQPWKVKAIYGGASQTRRINGLNKINERSGDFSQAIVLNDGTWSFWHPGNVDEKWVRNIAYPDGGGFKCPYGVLGDRLWVRETWEFLGTDMNRHGRTHMVQDAVIKYWADESRRTITQHWEDVEKLMHRKGGKKPSIHMPRWASRLTLEITNIRVERVLDISESDALKEGIDKFFKGGLAAAQFGYLWNKMHGKKHPWSSNPWVWIVEFKKVD